MSESRGVLIFDKWAEEVNCRVEAWRLPNGDVRLVLLSTQFGMPLYALTLASYRADDLCKALERPHDG